MPGSRPGGKRCEFCGIRYADVTTGASFTEVRDHLRREHDKRISETNDYSLPPRRAAVLGRMHQEKVEAFDEHVRTCWESGVTHPLRNYDLAETTRSIWSSMLEMRLKGFTPWLEAPGIALHTGVSLRSLQRPIMELRRAGLLERMTLYKGKYAYRVVVPETQENRDEACYKFQAGGDGVGGPDRNVHSDRDVGGDLPAW
jgi:DNA-binding transcriptional ArsR family regulator